jgi:hypothetical protein
VDFIVETRRPQSGKPAHVVCIEVELSTRWERKWERAMRDLSAHPGIQVDRMIGVYTGERAWHFDGLDVWPVEQFLQALHAGGIF